MDLKEAVQLVYQGNAILLLGAGFSVHSKNADGKFLPTGGQLVSLLAGDLGIEDRYPLPVIATRYIDKLGEAALASRLSTIFSAETITPDQERVALMPWRRAYTLNYDNVFEKIYERRGSRLAELNFDDHVRTTDGPLQYVHLHGELHSGNSSTSDLVLNVESYNSILSSSGWFSRFRSDVELADCVIAVGCSMSDLHLSSLFYNDPVIQGKTFFVDYEGLDEVWQGNLNKFGHVYPIGLRSFADVISAIPAPTLKRRVNPVSFEQYTSPVDPRPASGTDVFDLVLMGDLKSGVALDVTQKSKTTYNLWRDDAEALVVDIAGQDSPRRYLIHSDLGNGKTLVCDSLKYALAARGYTVLTLKSVRDIISVDIPYLSELSPKTVIFVDDIFRTNNRSDLIALVNQFSHFVFIGTCRTSVFELQGHEAHLILGPSHQEYEVNTLSDRECDQIVEWFDTNGLWGAEAGLSSVEKRRVLTNRCRREFRSVILDRFNSQFMREKIDKVFKSIPSGRVRDWLLFALIVEICGMDANARFIQSVAGFSPSRRDLDGAGPIREFVGIETGHISIRSPVLSQFLVGDMYNEEEKVSALVSIAQACNRNTNGRDAYSELLKLTYRPAVMASLFKGGRYLESAKLLFDELKKLEYLQSKSLFWLQYAIVLTNEKEYFSAKVIFDTAYGKARNSDFDTFQVDNHYARFKLESCMYAPDLFPEAFASFQDAHAKIRAQIIRDTYATHPYRVAELYPEFLALRWDAFDSQQRRVLRRNVAEMIEFLSKTRVRNKSQKIATTLAALESFLTGVGKP